MVLTILDHNNKELYKQGQQRQQQEWQDMVSLHWHNNNFECTSCFFFSKHGTP